MGKKFSIIKTVDTEKLHNEVNNYMTITGEYNPYIFMNIDTLEAVASEFIPTVKLRTYGMDGYTSQYEGNKVFVNNDLKFGEVEIR